MGEIRGALVPLNNWSDLAGDEGGGWGGGVGGWAREAGKGRWGGAPDASLAHPPPF